MKRFLMWAGIILITPLLLILLLAVMLYLPPVQDFAVRKAAGYVSELTGKQVSIGRLRLSFPLDLDLQELCVMDGTDTLLATRHTIVDLNLSEALSWRVGLDGVSLKDVQVDSGSDSNGAPAGPVGGIYVARRRGSKGAARGSE